MRPGLRLSLIALIATVASIHAGAPALHAQGAAAQGAAVVQSPPQAPPPSAQPAKTQDPPPPQADDQDAKKQRGIDRVRVRVEGHEGPIRGGTTSLTMDGFYPLVGEIVAVSGLSAGVGYQRLRLGSSRIGIGGAAEVSYRGFQQYRLHVGYIEHRDTTEALQSVDAIVTSIFNDHAVKSPGMAAYADARYIHYPAEVFFGLGPTATEVNRTEYLLLGTIVDGVLQYQFTPSFGVSGRAGLLAPALGRGSRDSVEGRFGLELVPGLVGVPRYLTTGFAGAYDVRDDPGDPHAGYFLGGAIWRFSGLTGGEYDFVRVTGDARWYRQVFSPRGVLAVRALASDERPDTGARVPYYLQQTLGGSESLRGFPAYRFRARALATGSAEYRFQVSSFLDIGPFVDVGTVAPTFALLSVNDLEWSGGVRAGLRFKNAPLVTVGWGRSREGHRFFIGAGTLF